jgi:hypothetical protein
MTEIINGRKCCFELGSDKPGIGCVFFIRAICKSSKRSSFINNLNAILSEFEIDIDDPKMADSTWAVTYQEAQSLEVVAREFLESNSFLDYLEIQLDEDRMLSEWENIYNSNIIY